MEWDHPRSRGVYPVTGGDGFEWGGIIPARAGFTSTMSPFSLMAADHPRSRGVYRLPKGDIPRLAGSSPLARGLRSDHSQAGVRGGIIPARAGFTFNAVSQIKEGEDHPRSRGVYRDFMRKPLADPGSSPLARGLLGDVSRDRPSAGIIPARAGFTRRELRWRGSLRDHPRSRGVYHRGRGPGHGVRGSSPLARGLHFRAVLVPALGRIIPARAGFTRPAISGSPAGWDHPRSRGVYRTLSRFSRARIGSSPLARGLRVFVSCFVCSCGIIPARAGFTSHPGHPRAGRRDHPRSRGVYSCGL